MVPPPSIAVNISRYLENRYGKPTSYLIGGAVLLIPGVILAVLYLQFYPVVTEEDLTSVEITVSRYAVRKDSLDIWWNDRCYSARDGFWRPSITDEDLSRALASHDRVMLWLYRDWNDIFGLRAGDITIPRKAGVKEYMGGRFAMLLLSAGGLVGGIVAMAYGVRLQLHARRSSLP